MKKSLLKKLILYSLLFSNFLLAANPKSPLVSIITSLYKGDEFIQGFMEDIVQQTIFDKCELIIINANSPGKEDEVINEYVARYRNIIYIKLDRDPGLYSVWNYAIKRARGKFITNANVDDRLEPHCYEVHAEALNRNPHIDLVYSDSYITRIANETFMENSHDQVTQKAVFSKKAMRACLPGQNPMWRKSMHDKYGYFNEQYKISGDYEMWLRAVNQGSQLLKVSGVYGLYYENPKGLSTDLSSRLRLIEKSRIIDMYGHIFRDRKI